MKVFYLLLFLLIIELNVVSQNQLKTEIKLDEGCCLLKNFAHNNEGFVVMTGRPFGKSDKVTWNLKYFTTDLKEVWDIKIPKHYKTSQTTMNVIYSPFSDYFYIIETESLITEKDQFCITDICYITQVDYKGNVKSTELKDLIKKDERQIAVFVSKNYFNLVLRNENTVVLTSFSHNDFGKKSKELPIIGAYESKQNSSCSFWHFEAQTQDKIFLAKKIYGGFSDKKVNTFNYTIVSIDEEGQILDNITINTKLTNCFPVASVSGYENGSWISSFQTLNTSSGTSGGTFYKVYVHSVGAIEFDVKKQSIFVYGMMNREYVDASKALMTQKKPDGFYVEKFDFHGNKKWQIVKDFEPGFSKNIAPLPHYRAIGYSEDLLSVSSNTDNVSGYNYLISDSGEIIKLYQDSNTNNPITVYLNGLKIDSKWNPDLSKTRKVNTLSVNDRDILLDYNPEKVGIDILSFPNK